MPRTLKVGDTWPPLRGEAQDAQGNPLDLSGALTLELIIKSNTHQIFGLGGSPNLPLASALWPAVADPDGVHLWNWEYEIAVADMGVVGIYVVNLKVTWATNEFQTFPNDGGEALIIEAI